MSGILTEVSVDDLVKQFIEGCQQCRESVERSGHRHWTQLCVRHTYYVKAHVDPGWLVGLRREEQRLWKDVEDTPRRIEKGNAWLKEVGRTERELELGKIRLQALELKLRADTKRHEEVARIFWFIKSVERGEPAEEPGDPEEQPVASEETAVAA